MQLQPKKAIVTLHYSNGALYPYYSAGSINVRAKNENDLIKLIQKTAIDKGYSVIRYEIELEELENYKFMQNG